MRDLGILVLLNVVVVSAYCIFAAKLETKSVSAFAAIGLVVGAALILSDRITHVKVPGVGEISAVVLQAQADAGEIADVRKQVEQQRDAIALIARDANAAREQITQIEKLSQEARQKADEVETVASKAADSLAQIGKISDFTLTLASARNDDRQAFNRLIDVADAPGPFQQLALAGVQEVVQAADPMLQVRVDPNVPWAELHIDPATESLENLRAAYTRIPNHLRPPFLSAVWGQDRLPKHDRLALLVDVLKQETSLRALHRACVLINTEAKINMNILGVPQYLKWWADHEADYRGQ